MTKEPIPAAYSRMAMVLVGLIAFFFILYITKEIVVPLVFALLVAIVLNPLVKFMSRHKVPRVLAIALSLLLAIVFLGGLVAFLIAQASMFKGTMPLMQTKLAALLQEAHAWMTQRVGSDPLRFDAWLTKSEDVDMRKGIEAATRLSNTVIQFVLVPVYAFLILLYKNLLLAFLKKMFDRQQHDDLNAVLVETKAIVQNYLMGLLIQIVIVSVLNTAALLAIGVPYAVLLGTVGGLLTVIPYLGGIVGAALMLVVTLVTGSTTDVLLVAGANLVIQFLNNHFIVPRFVASRVKLNALVSIVIVVAAGAFWGVPGMFLSIPITGIVKAVCDRVERLQPWGLLLGDVVPEEDAPVKKRPIKRVA